MIEEEKSGTKAQFFWYLSFVAALILLALYWQKYIEMSTVAQTIELLIPKFASVIIILFFVNVFLRISIPVVNKAASLYFRNLEVYLRWEFP